MTVYICLLSPETHTCVCVHLHTLFCSLSGEIQFAHLQVDKLCSFLSFCPNWEECIWYSPPSPSLHCKGEIKSSQVLAHFQAVCCGSFVSCKWSTGILRESGLGWAECGKIGPRRLGSNSTLLLLPGRAALHKLLVCA